MLPLIADRGAIAVADIFISYSQADRDKVELLAAYLESEGWTVWWDKNLKPGEPYRDEIMRELAAARAVIVLWTPSSIKSDFVRAEAGRAKADGKLIPVKTDDVAYGDIPLPFGEMHTESLSKKELIRAALVAQLARPAVQPSDFWLATRIFRYQVLTWFGIVGGAITVFANLRGVLHLAVWASWIVGHWQAWINTVWQWVFALVPIRVPPYWTPFLTFAVFALLTAGGQRILYATAHKGPQRAVPSDAPTLALKQAFLFIFLSPFVSLLAMISVEFFLRALRGSVKDEIVIVTVMVFLAVPLAALFFMSKHRLRTAICLAIILALYVTVTLIPVSTALPMPDISGSMDISLTSNAGPDPGDVSLAIFLSLAISALMLWIAPINALTKRLVFLGLGVVILIALNEISKYSDGFRTYLNLST